MKNRRIEKKWVFRNADYLLVDECSLWVDVSIIIIIDSKDKPIYFKKWLLDKKDLNRRLNSVRMPAKVITFLFGKVK